MRSLASNVQAGSSQAADFTTKYFLPKRTAYVAVFEEIQRMAKAPAFRNAMPAGAKSRSKEPPI